MSLARVVGALAADYGLLAAVVPVNQAGFDSPRAADRAAGLAAAAQVLALVCGPPTESDDHGCDTAPAVRGHHEDGRPIFPTGCIGSISHAALMAAAVVGPTGTHRAVGLDLDAVGALPAADAPLVLDAAERAAVAERSASDPAAADRLATAIWCAKEAAFKAWSVMTDGRMGTVDPCDIAVSPAKSLGTVHATPIEVRATGSLAQTVRGQALRGTVVSSDGFVIVLVVDQPDDDPRGPGSSASG